MFHKGDRVDYHSVIGGPVTIANCVVTDEPFEVDSGHLVTFISGKIGCVAVDALTTAVSGEEELK